ncbi:beta-L-arabinofuranosidase domain-containing protein [Georgenia sp. MJ173]|uniref:glycoside hydrolase family 127 protein n=1 Tax=Georgenia sunbinii TaxID=3117728 RepID=UPI002F2650A7
MTANLDTPSTDTAARSARPVVPARGHRRGVGIREVTLDGGFWGTRQRTNAAATLRHCLDWMDRLGWLANFDAVAEGRTGGERPGWQFSDSEVYKLMEALAWEHGRAGDPDADALLRRLTTRIAAAQDADGYLNTCFGHAGQRARYSDLEMGHELYCTGHLLQAAVARLRTTGQDELVAVARRAADHVYREFGPGGREGICGHPEIEVALAEFGRATGEARYVELAQLFVERRGRGLLAPVPLLSSAYFQDDIPVREAHVWRGHAVRALYLAAGALDTAVDLADDELFAAVQAQWQRSVERRTYLTGGMGSRHQDEGFGDDWELPADRAYCETCAGIASVMVSWRLFLATGEVRYADLIERTMYNVVATSPREDGRAFFYANPLQQRVPGSDVPQDAENARAEGGVRAPWFDVSCCPTNVARTLASAHTYLAATDGDTLTLLQYAAGELAVDLAAGGRLRLRVATSYPDDGAVDVVVLDVPDRPVQLRLRVPSWAAGATIARGGGPATDAEPGWIDVPDLRAGERIRLELPMTARLTWPDPRIDGLRGSVAVERGPLVMCLESTDLAAADDLADVLLDPTTELRTGPGGTVLAGGWITPGEDVPGALPYRSGPAAHPRPGRAVDLELVPYHQWAERGPAQMRVFLPVHAAKEEQ